MEEIAEQSYDAMEAYLLAQQKHRRNLKRPSAGRTVRNRSSQRKII